MQFFEHGQEIDFIDLHLFDTEARLKNLSDIINKNVITQAFEQIEYACQISYTTHKLFVDFNLSLSLDFIEDDAIVSCLTIYNHVIYMSHATWVLTKFDKEGRLNDPYEYDCLF